MAIVFTDNKYYAEIAAAIRQKNGSSDKYTPAQMAAAILALGNSSRLPEGYTELEYIRSTGEQFVNTQFASTGENLRIVLDFEYTAAHSTLSLFGSQSTDGTFSIIAYDAPAFYVGTTPNLLSQSIATNDRTVLDAHANSGTLTVSLNGSTKSAHYSGELDKNLPISLFGNNFKGTTTQLVSAIYYSCQIYDNGTLVRDYVPCLNPSNEVGLYDIVNGVFYGNAGTGYFLPGPAVSLPEGYTRLSHIESTGTQYIDAKFTPNQDTRVVLDMMLTASSAQYLFSAPLTSGKYFGCSYVSGYYAEYGSKTTKSSITGVNTRMVIDANKKNFTFGSTTVTMEASSFTSSGNLFLFACNPADFQASMLVYSCQIYDNDTIVRDFVPCKNPDGEVGLYDTIGGKFYGNAGTGAFTGA